MTYRHMAEALLICSTVGCATSYVPVPSPRVSLVLEGGAYAYARDGRKYAGGILGGQIEEAVRGNPEAESRARAYKTETTIGVAMGLVGLGGFIAGLAVVESDAVGRPATASVPATGLVIAGVGLIVEAVGLILELDARPRLFDAINVYNDGLRGRTP